MNKLERQLQKIKEEKRIGLMTHVVVGYPDLEETREVILAMVREGVDMVELQIPFSDPMADGTTIMRACEEALEKRTRVADAFTLMKELSGEVSIPLFFMGYYNTVFKYGVERFCRDAEDAGAAGLMIPDMPIEEEGEEHFYKYCEKYGLRAVHVISPASTEERLRKNAELAKGFVYCMARQGTTGTRKELEGGLAEYLERVKGYFEIPVAVGFGISEREHVEALKGHAEIAVVGSAVIEVIAGAKHEERIKRVAGFISKLTEKE